MTAPNETKRAEVRSSADRRRPSAGDSRDRNAWENGAPACMQTRLYVKYIPYLHIPVTQLVHRDKHRISEAYNHASDLASAERAQQQIHLTIRHMQMVS